MRKLMIHIAGCMTLLTALSCTGSSRQAGDATAAPSDTLIGKTFTGSATIGPDTAEWHLEICHKPHSGDGNFSLSITRTGTTQRFSGRRYTLRGTDDDIDATLWQCKADSTLWFDFLVENDSTLRLLPQGPETEEHDTLRLSLTQSE